MKLPMLVIALLAVGSQQQCQNPFQAVTNPTPLGPRSPQEFCAQTSTDFGPMFYCQSSQANLQAGLPNGWTGYCQAAIESLGNAGYSWTTSSGGASPVMSQSSASAQCNSVNSGLIRACSTIIRCTRP